MPRATEPRLVRFAGRKQWHIYDRRHRVSTSTESRAEAELLLARYIEERSRPQTEIVSTGFVLERYLANRRAEQKRGAERLQFAHKALHRILGTAPPQTITTARCRAFADQRRSEGVRDTTIRTELQALRAALNWAATPEIKLITEAPKIVMPLRPQGRIRWLTRQEAERLLAATKAPHMRLFILIGLHTGSRSGAILSLMWERVDLDQRLIDFRDPDHAETRKRRVPVRINDTLFAALQEAQQLATTPFVIEWAGNRIDRVKRAFRETAMRAQLHDVTPHVLRHTCVTWLLQAGVPVWEVAGFVGMTPEMVQEVYGHHHPDYHRRAAAALG
jgi:integrase